MNYKYKVCLGRHSYMNKSSFAWAGPTGTCGCQEWSKSKRTSLQCCNYVRHLQNKMRWINWSLSSWILPLWSVTGPVQDLIRTSAVCWELWFCHWMACPRASRCAWWSGGRCQIEFYLISWWLYRLIKMNEHTLKSAPLCILRSSHVFCSHDLPSPWHHGISHVTTAGPTKRLL